MLFRFLEDDNCQNLAVYGKVCEVACQAIGFCRQWNLSNLHSARLPECGTVDVPELSISDSGLSLLSYFSASSL